MLFSTLGRSGFTNLLATREVDYEVIAVEFHYLANQVGTYVVAPGGNGAVYMRQERHNHTNRQSAVARKRQMLTK